ncbi:MAG: FAD:protein FMN transferase, partial [Desulfonatronovibrionaceae bacterium]
LTKEVSAPVLNLSGVAKGFAADAIAKELESLGITSFLIDIGGEVLAGEKKPDGSLWQVGIAVPLPQAEADQVVSQISLAGQAVATSGDYRNFFIHNNTRYSHIIDPATGFPVRQEIISASIKAESCALADALATAALVMNKEDFFRLAQTSGSFEALLISRGPSSRLNLHATRGFE